MLFPQPSRFNKAAANSPFTHTRTHIYLSLHAPSSPPRPSWPVLLFSLLLISLFLLPFSPSLPILVDPCRPTSCPPIDQLVDAAFIVLPIVIWSCFFSPYDLPPSFHHCSPPCCSDVTSIPFDKIGVRSLYLGSSHLTQYSMLQPDTGRMRMLLRDNETTRYLSTPQAISLQSCYSNHQNPLEI